MDGEYPPARRRSGRRTRGWRAVTDPDTDGFGGPAGFGAAGEPGMPEPGAAGTGDDSAPAQPAWSDEWTARDAEERGMQRGTRRRARGSGRRELDDREPGGYQSGGHEPGGYETSRRGNDRDGRRGNGREDGGDSEDPESQARQICLRQLSFAPKTRAQLRDAIVKRDIPGEVADTVLSRFADVGLIDDAAFAKAWVESRHYSKGLSSRALKSELRRRGVGNEEIDEAVATLDPDSETETARRLVERRIGSTRGLPTETRTRRLAGMLARKGYPAGLAFRIIREALEAEGVAGEEAEAVLGDDPPSDWS